MDADFKKQYVGAAEPTHDPGLILSSPTAKAFDLCNQMVVVGIVQLNRVSQYLVDLPNARAEYLISPQSTATLFDRELGTWNQDTASIRSIDESYGLHFNGQALTGMPIFDRPPNAPYVPYERAWAEEIRKIWEKVSSTREAVTSGLAIMPVELIDGRDGRNINYRIVTVANNMRSRVGHINRAILGPYGEGISGGPSASPHSWQYTATEITSMHTRVLSVCLEDGETHWNLKNEDRLSSSRAGALHVLAPGLD